MALYPPTCESVINGVKGQQREAGDVFYRDYYGPLAHLARYDRRLPAAEAERLAHEFLSDVVVRPRLLELWDPEKGSFHRYLQKAFHNYVNKQRAPIPLIPDGCPPIDVHGSPSVDFEKRYALERILDALRELQRESERVDIRRWRLFVLRVLNPIVDGTRPPDYQEFYKQIGYESDKEARNAFTNVRRAIRRYLRHSLRQRIAQPCGIQRRVQDRAETILRSQPDLAQEDAEAVAQQEVESELGSEVESFIRYFRAVLSQRGPSGDDTIAPDPAKSRPSREPSPQRPAESGAIAQDDAMASQGGSDRKDSLKDLVSSYLDPSEQSRGSVCHFDAAADRQCPPLPDLNKYDLRDLAAVLQVTDSHELGALAESLQERLCLTFREYVQDGLQIGMLLPESERESMMTRLLADVLLDPTPNVTLLKACKDEAHRRRKQAKRDEVTSVLYYAPIAAALARAGQRITSLSDRDLLRGLDWASEHAWIDQEIRALAREAARRLKASDSSG